MEIFAMIFAVFMIAAAVGLTAIIGWSTGFWGGLAFAVFLVILYRAATYQSVPDRRGPHHGCNAFQRWISDD